LNELFDSLKISKQAVFQARTRQKRFDMELIEIVKQVDLIREEHPGCGVEKLYRTLKPKYLGRDKFCEVFMGLGYGIRRVKNYRKTTIPAHLNYPNLIEGMLVTGPYKILQSDITYFELGDRFYYIVFIIDVYTKEILGYNVCDNMRKEANVKALKMALKGISFAQRKNMIHHSDRGSQYGSNEYTKILKDTGVRISMGLKAQDNAYAERINGTIKNEYLNLWYINDFKTLKRYLKNAVMHYNQKRVHDHLINDCSPAEFKKKLVNLSPQERPKAIIYAEGNYKVKVALSHVDFTPREEPLAHNCPIGI
jgi:transposase InsO family protein